MALKFKVSPGVFNTKDLVIRHLIIALMAIFFGFLGKFNLSVQELAQSIFSTFVLISFIWNGNVLLMDIIDRLYGWDKHLHVKLIISGTIALLWPIISTYFFNLVIFPIINGHPCNLQSKETITYLVVSVVLTLFINSVFVAIAFFRFWKDSIKEKEELKRESLSAEYEALKSQINPHFLFNSLNTLSSLIDENPKTANDFVQKLSSVYRYLLTQRDKEIVQIKEELAFVNAYVYLNQIRFGKNLNVQVDVPTELTDKKIVTLALQILIENAIKHNIISGAKPLYIYMGIVNNKFIVKNNLQRKQVMNESNGIGLNNIVHRYSFLTQLEVEITETNNEFSVALPLL
jgi:hypothetical protein